jgi:hypothetical protein
MTEVPCGLAIKNTKPKLTIFRTENRDNYRMLEIRAQRVFNIEDQALS